MIDGIEGNGYATRKVWSIVGWSWRFILLIPGDIKENDYTLHHL
jgi:hypothetical protein